MSPALKQRKENRRKSLTQIGKFRSRYKEITRPELAFTRFSAPMFYSLDFFFLFYQEKRKAESFDQELSWCLDPTQQQRDKLDEIKDEPHKGCIAAKGFLELIEGLPLPDYRILPRSERLMFFSEEKKQNGKEEVVQIYPNPTTNWITIHINIQLEQTYFISVFDVTGKCVNQETTNKNTFDLNLSKFSRGLYSVHIRNENEIIYIGKIMKE